MSQLFADLTDEALCLRAAAGDAGAEEALILRYGRVVRSCARPLFLAGGDSEDLLQEGMLGLLTAIGQFDPERDVAFRTFAEVCIRNRLRSAVRSASREKHLALNTSVSLESAEVERDVAPAPTPEELMIARETRSERLRGLQRGLSRLERQVLELYLTGLSYDEIAQVTHKSAKSVDNAVQRIRHKLARL